MKLPQKIQTKQTVRLFNGKYKYKIVLLSKAASWFRGADLANVKKCISSAPNSNMLWVKKLDTTDINYSLKLVTALTPMSDYMIRVESPYINFYTNKSEDIEKLAKINADNVKYVCAPMQGSESDLDMQKIIVKKLDYNYRVTMGKTSQSYSNFVTWAEDKPEKIKLPKRARSQLTKSKSWGGYYFYVKDDKLLTVVKVFLGGDIQHVEQCVKQ